MEIERIGSALLAPLPPLATTDREFVARGVIEERPMDLRKLDSTPAARTAEASCAPLVDMLSTSKVGGEPETSRLPQVSGFCRVEGGGCFGLGGGGGQEG